MHVDSDIRADPPRADIVRILRAVNRARNFPDFILDFLAKRRFEKLCET